jgi:hypothetical protein
MSLSGSCVMTASFHLPPWKLCFLPISIYTLICAETFASTNKPIHGGDVEILLHTHLPILKV